MAQAHTHVTGETLTAANLNSNYSGLYDGLDGGVKAINVGKILVDTNTVIDNARAATFTDLTVDNLNVNGNTISATSGAITFTAAAGSAVAVEGVSFDGGVVTGASSITSTAFVGTLSTAAQPNITSLGTLTTLTVDDITINANTISSAGASALTITATAGQVVSIESVTLDGGVVAGVTTLTTSGAINSQTISSAANFTGSLTTAGVVSVDDTTQSTSTTTGSIHTDGGAGIAKDVIVGGRVGINNTTPGSAFAGADNLSVGSGTGDEGMTIWTGASSIARILFSGASIGAGEGAIRYDHANESFDVYCDGGEVTSTHKTTGFTVSLGGISVDVTTDSTSTTTGSIHTDGGVGIVKKLNLGGDFLVGTNSFFIDSTNKEIGIGTVSPTANLHIIQGNISAAIPCVKLDQRDVSEPFMDFIGTSAASAANSISSWTTGNAVQGHVKMDVNGTERWVRFYDAPTS